MVNVSTSWKVPLQVALGVASGAGAYFGISDRDGETVGLIGAAIVAVGVAWLAGRFIFKDADA